MVVYILGRCQSIFGLLRLVYILYALMCYLPLKFITCNLIICMSTGSRFWVRNHNQSDHYKYNGLHRRYERCVIRSPRSYVTVYFAGYFPHFVQRVGQKFQILITFYWFGSKVIKNKQILLRVAYLVEIPIMTNDRIQ